MRTKRHIVHSHTLNLSHGFVDNWWFLTTLKNPNDKFWALFTPNLSRPLRTSVVMTDETPENIARNDDSVWDKITEAEETAHYRKINKRKEAEETAAHCPPVYQEHDHRGETGVATLKRVGETIKKDALETATSGGRRVDHKVQHLPGHLQHLEERDGNEVAMNLPAREHRQLHPCSLLASNDALTAANTAISKRIA